MKLIISAVLWLLFILPNAAGSAEETEFKIMAFQEGTKELLKSYKDWKTCGDYFATTDSDLGRIIYFHFERTLPGNKTFVLVFTTMDRIDISIQKRMAAPRVSVQGRGQNTIFTIRVNEGDYRTGLPCLARGESIKI